MKGDPRDAPTERSPYREPVPRPPPPKPALGVLAVLAVIALALAAFTSHKLYVMAMLRGDVDGIAPRELVLGDPTLRWGTSARYALREPTVTEASPFHIQLTTAQADAIGRGGKVTVRCLETDRNCYMAGSTYIDDGNRAFDVGLLVLELAGFVACISSMVRRRRAHALALRASAVRPPA